MLQPRAFILVTVLLFAATGALAAPPGEIAVVCDQDVGPYRVLVESFARASTLPVRVISAAEAQIGLEDRLRREGARAVLAVGLRSRVAVEPLRELPVLLAMVPRVAPWVAAQPNRLGIEMALAPRQNLETMRRVFPRARRIGLVFDPEQTGGYVRAAVTVAADLRLTLDAREISRPAELSRLIEELRGRADVIWLLPDPTVLQPENLEQLLLASFEARIPLYGFARKYAELGAVAAAHLDPAAMGAQAAEMLATAIDRPPAGAAERWRYAVGARLVVNQKIARKMGIDLDPALLKEADDVLR